MENLKQVLDYRDPQDEELSQDQRIFNLRKDITGHKETERLLRADMVYKDILLAEISHRVMNGFQFISGILQVQAQISPDETVKQQLEIAAQRVLSMGLVHRRLYESANDIATVNSKSYLTGLCQELRAGFFSAGGNNILSLDAVADLDLPTGIMAFIGLAVSELVTNACKYAYKAGDEGTIAVALNRHNDGYILSVSDDGVGLPADFQVHKSKGLGMNIVKAQVKELKGVLEIDMTRPGVKFIIHIPA